MLEKLSPEEQREFERLISSAKAETIAYYKKSNNNQQVKKEPVENLCESKKEVILPKSTDYKRTYNKKSHLQFDKETILLLLIAFILYKEKGDVLTILVLVYIALS